MSRDVIELCQDFIKARSYSGQEDWMAGEVAAAMDEAGFVNIRRDDYGSVIGEIVGSEPGPIQLYDAHIDTVPVPDPSVWTYPPFGGEFHDGKVYGRGASDMKGALAAMIKGGQQFRDRCDGQFKGRICVAGVVHEECFEGIGARSVSTDVKPDYVIIGEASSLNLKRGQRGRCEIVIETFGKPAHSANPEVGINAVSHMAEVIQAIESLSCPVDSVLGKGILVLTDIISSPYPGASVVPSHCRTTWDRRLLVGETPESVMAPIEKVLEDLENGRKIKSRVSIAEETLACYTGNSIGGSRFFPAWLYSEEETFVSKSLAELKAAGIKADLTHYDFCTNGSHYAGEAGIPTIGFGPSRENLAHTIDEYIEADQLIQAVIGYEALMSVLSDLG